MRFHLTNALPPRTLPDFAYGLDPFDALLVPSDLPDRSPRYDIKRTDEKHYRVHLAVPGYADADLEITQDADDLVVTGQACEDENGVTTVERGIDTHGFRRRFRLGEHVVVTGAELDRGILRVDLAVEVPEELRPRRIEIGEARQTEGERAAA